MKKGLLLLVFILILSGCYLPELEYEEDYYNESYKEAELEEKIELKEVIVDRVVDGDTFIYYEGNKKIRVRCIGIDTPESVAPKETGKVNTKEGKTASEYVTELIEGKPVYLEYDVEKYDQYDRELAYVYLEDGQMLEVILLELGYAKTMTIEPDTKYADYFKELEDIAKREGVGFWSE